ncbi:hypothetical protein NWI01_15880 [Nitrobacter winogradskyi]|uniref:Uncharacterized protein n=1 Tax=Nitrobacter winogradskyi TaxID=913 RepID=A0A4Y3WEN0_NITWI|nr:hypothetical protein NWI01_15880 [Nitrobacter winogradskyi]
MIPAESAPIMTSAETIAGNITLIFAFIIRILPMQVKLPINRSLLIESQSLIWSLSKMSQDVVL